MLRVQRDQFRVALRIVGHRGKALRLAYHGQRFLVVGGVPFGDVAGVR